MEPAPDALATVTQQARALSQEVQALSEQAAAIADPLERYRAWVPLERALRRGADAAAGVCRGGIVELYEQQPPPKNLAAIGRLVELSRERVRALLVAAGVFAADGNGRRRAAR
jgi:hypothetical protein